MKAFLQVRGYPKDAEVRGNLSEKSLYGQGDRRTKCKFVLSAIENSYGHKEKVDLTKEAGNDKSNWHVETEIK